MKVHGGKCFQISIACCLICVGLGYEMEIVETVHKVLNNFNAPLKLTIDTCWDAGKWMHIFYISIFCYLQILFIQITFVVLSRECIIMVLII